MLIQSTRFFSISGPQVHALISGTSPYLLADNFAAPGIANADALDNSRLQDRVPETSVGGAKYTEASGVWRLVHNRAANFAAAGAATRAAVYYETGIADGTLSCIFKSIAGWNGFGGIVFRATGPDDYWFAGIRETGAARTAILYSVDAGVLTSKGSAVVDRSTSTNALSVVLSGNSIKVYSDGVQKFSIADAARQTATLHGLGTVGGVVTDIMAYYAELDTFLVKNSGGATVMSDTFDLWTGTEALASHAPQVGGPWSILTNTFTTPLACGSLEWLSGTDGLMVANCNNADVEIEAVVDAIYQSGVHYKTALIGRSNVDGTNRLALVLDGWGTSQPNVYPYTDLTTLGAELDVERASTAADGWPAVPIGVQTVRWGLYKNELRIWINDVMASLGQSATYLANTYHGIGNREGGGIWRDIKVRPCSALGWKTMSILGDSIEADTKPYSKKWAHRISYTHNGGRYRTINHAVSGTGVLQGASNFAAQVAAAASDDADIIVIALGTNDDNGGNMATLQAAVESGLTTLKSTNPRATIYWMNVLPRWTDVGGATPVNKANIRAAIAAGCLAKAVTCWDTFTDPWIAAADTSDGLHPTETVALSWTNSGHDKIRTRGLALLPV